MHRFFISPEKIGDTQVILTADQAHQITRVLRMKPGDGVIVLDNLGWEFEVRITAVSGKEVTADILEKRKAEFKGR